MKGLQAHAHPSWCNVQNSELHSIEDLLQSSNRDIQVSYQIELGRPE